jgi:hypothetical protein
MRDKLPKHRRLTAAIVSMLAVLVALSSVGGALAKLQTAGGSPASGHAEVIAQGVAELPNIPVIWRVAKLDAQPAENAADFERVLGFALADRAAVLVTDNATGNENRLAPGEALFVH